MKRRLTLVFLITMILCLDPLMIPKVYSEPPPANYSESPQDYAFVDNPNFFRGPGGGPPPEPPTFNWQISITEHGKMGVSSFAYISTGKARIRLETYENFFMDTIGLVQGHQAHKNYSATYLLGSNTTFEDRVYINSSAQQILFMKNDTGSISPDYKLFVRARLIDKTVTVPVVEGGAAFFRPMFNLGISISFQFEYYDYFDNQYHVSDYDNPDPFHGDSENILLRRTPWATSCVFTDMIIIGESWDAISGWQPWTGVGTHNYAMDYADTVSNQYYGPGVDDFPEGIWYTTSISLKDFITKVFEDVNAYFMFKGALYDGYDKNLTAMWLKSVAVYIEGIGTDTQAEIDYLFIQNGNTVPLTVEAYSTGSPPRRLASFVSFDDVYWGTTPQTVFLPVGLCKVSVSSYVFQFEESDPLRPYWSRYSLYKFKEWSDGVTGFYTNTRSVNLTEPTTLTAYYDFLMFVYAYAGAGGAGDYRLLSPSPELVTHGNLTSTNSSYIDQYVFAKARTSLGNNLSSFNLAASAYHKLVVVHSNGVERIDIDLGKLWQDSPYIKSWFGLVTAPMDDITIDIQHDNVSRFDLYLKNVPNVLSVQKNALTFDQWNYTDGTLHIWLYPWDHSEITIDFETGWSLMYTSVFQLSTVLIAVLVLAWLYRFMRNTIRQ